MATGEPSKPVEHPCSFMKTIGLKIGKDSNMPCPVTIASGASYGLLSVSMFNPDILQKISPSRDITNVIMASTFVGGSLYLASRPHLATISDTKQRVLFCVYGSTMVTLGSLLLWAMLRVLVPNNTAARTVAAVGSSIILLKTGKAYLQVIDDAVAKKSK